MWSGRSCGSFGSFGMGGETLRWHVCTGALIYTQTIIIKFLNHHISTVKHEIHEVKVSLKNIVFMFTAAHCFTNSLVPD